MPTYFSNRWLRKKWRSLLAMLLLNCTGCATQWCHLPDDCAHAFGQTQLGWELQDICKSCNSFNSYPRDTVGCGEGLEGNCDDDAVWLDKPRPAHRAHIKVGPPPEPYQPPMPPKFLPVPASSVF